MDFFGMIPQVFGVTPTFFGVAASMPTPLATRPVYTSKNQSGTCGKGSGIPPKAEGGLSGAPPSPTPPRSGRVPAGCPPPEHPKSCRSPGLSSASPILLPRILMTFPAFFFLIFFFFFIIFFYSKWEFFPFPSPQPLVPHSWGGRPGVDEVASSRPSPLLFFLFPSLSIYT